MEFCNTNLLRKRRNTLCISRAIPHKSARESGERIFVRKRCKTAEIVCVFQGFTNAFLAEKIRQNSRTHLCGVASGFRSGFVGEKNRQSLQPQLCGVALNSLPPVIRLIAKNPRAEMVTAWGSIYGCQLMSASCRRGSSRKIRVVMA